jgi:flavin-binding protein dodecin
MSASVTKVIEVIGSSSAGADDAASRSIRGITTVEVMQVTCDVEDGSIVRWNALVKIAFPVEPHS